MFCQACGADNSKDARFCNMCGATIAAAGSPGGPVAAEPTALGIGADSEPAPAPALGDGDPTLPTPREPAPESTSMMNVSLEDLGVRSNTQAGLVLAGAVVLLMALGGAFTYFGTHAEEPAQETGRAAAGDPFVIGAPIPEGLAAPLPDGEAPAIPPELEAPAGAESSSATAAESTRRPSSSRRPRQPASEPTATQQPAEAPDPPPGDTTEVAGAETPDATDANESEASATEQANRQIPTDAPEERDIELEMYAGRVRFLVQRYYSARAQTCFDHATVNDPSLHGTVVVDMTIASSGEVSRAAVLRNSTGDAELGQCLARQVGSWRLSPPPGGEQLEMQMPFSR